MRGQGTSLMTDYILKVSLVVLLSSSDKNLMWALN